MPRTLPIVSGEDVAKALERLGFERTRQRGSHLKLRNGVGRTVIVPMHSELARGTLGSVLDQAGLDVDTFVGALRR